MFTMFKRIALGLSLFVAGLFAQETPSGTVEKAAPPAPERAAEKSGDKEAGKAGKKSAEPTEFQEPRKVSPARVIAAAKKKAEARRVLKPEEVPGELMRLKTKADIKAELRIRTTSGQPVVFSGIIRNGKLIERIIDRRFVSQDSVAHPRSGVRIWWGGNSDGYIFFRYSTVETLSITGRLTAKERAEIMRRLKAKREGRDPDAEKKAAAKAAANRFADIEKMSPSSRGAYLMARYPAEKGWTGKRFRELRRKKILENVDLAPDDELFVKYYRVLEQVRYLSLRDAPTRKEEFEPGSEESEKGKQPAAEEEQEEE